MSKYKLINGILFKDGVMSICPKAPAMLKPAISPLGQKSFSIERFPCYLNCPHFVKEENEVACKCEADSKFTLDEIIETPPVEDKKSKLTIT
jgi:hypothetical protein